MRHLVSSAVVVCKSNTHVGHFCHFALSITTFYFGQLKGNESHGASQFIGDQSGHRDHSSGEEDTLVMINNIRLLLVLLLLRRSSVGIGPGPRKSGMGELLQWVHFLFFSYYANNDFRYFPFSRSSSSGYPANTSNSTRSIIKTFHIKPNSKMKGLVASYVCQPYT